MSKYKFRTLKILILSIAFQSPSFANDLSEDTLQNLGSHFNDGEFEIYPNYMGGVAMKNTQNGEYFLDGFPAHIVEGKLKLKTENLWNYRQGLIKSYGEKFGFNLKGKVNTSRVVIVDYTCPFSTSYVKKLEAKLPRNEFEEITFIPVSRNMEREVISKSLGLQCLPKQRAANTLVNSFVVQGESIRNKSIPSCNNKQDLYGLLNLMSSFKIEAVPALIEGGVTQKNPWEIFRNQ
ncbi:hypothetical protein [Vibrio sp. D431a]|uniref:hypothetical protein n=1 Tax=Vibrio sp. D431a TaxID=2837388 RepID=UPI00255266A5|nr:hypothetical protein [Vibrio sp. D431a]MDK9793810.1 hypothetical protein [Vibrio sp. D431a]